MIRVFCYMALLLPIASGQFRFDLTTHWEMYKKFYNKTYVGIEEGARRLIWERNVAKINKHNIEADLKVHSFKLGVNHLTDLTFSEYRMLNGLITNNNRTSRRMITFLPPSNVVYPEEVDWRKEGLVTEIKNQGRCGSCWAFSTTGALEGQHKRKTGVLRSLSEQNLVDCSQEYGNKGCDGGIIDGAFMYIKENGGIDTEVSYPYLGKEDLCHFKKTDIGATMSGYVDIPEGDETALMQAVATVGPVSVAIDASHESFQQYKSGIYDEIKCSSEKLDHGVLVVGYGTENGKDFWIVKNSWSEMWGENGYVKIARNKNNKCGIATMASYPLV